MRRDRDQVDYWCEEWAKPQRSYYGVRLDKMIEPYERIGHLRSTLASIREEGEGAAYSQVSQKWAEVHTPMGLLINRCFEVMRLQKLWQMRDTMVLEYVYEMEQWPRAKRCRDYGITVHFHDEHLKDTKIFINGFVAANPIPDDEAPIRRRAVR